MLARALVVLFITCFHSTVVAQRVIDKDVKSLHYIIDNFIQKKDRYSDLRKDEFVMMILEIDSSGVISNIHLLSDTKNVDSSYSILEKMTTYDFGGYKFESWKSKIINLPIYSLTGAGGIHNYVDGTIIHISSQIKTRKAMMIEPLYYMTPGGNPRPVSPATTNN